MHVVLNIARNKPYTILQLQALPNEAVTTLYIHTHIEVDEVTYCK